MTTYALTAAPTELARLVEDALRDGEVALTRDGQAIARVLPVVASVSNRDVEPRVFGSGRDYLSVPADFDAPLEDMRPYMEGPARCEQCLRHTVSCGSLLVTLG